MPSNDHPPNSLDELIHRESCALSDYLYPVGMGPGFNADKNYENPFAEELREESRAERDRLRGVLEELRGYEPGLEREVDDSHDDLRRLMRAAGETTLREAREEVLSAEGAQAAYYKRIVDRLHRLRDLIEELEKVVGEKRRSAGKGGRRTDPQAPVEEPLPETSAPPIIIDYMGGFGPTPVSPETPIADGVSAKTEAPSGIGAPPTEGGYVL